MSLLPFLTIAFGAGALSLLIGRVRRPSAVVGVGGLILATVLAASIRDDTPFAIAGGAIAGSAYVRLFLVMGCAGGLLVTLVALATSWPRSLPGATLLGLGAAGFALGVTDPGTAVAAATGGGVVGILITLVGRGTERGLIVAIRELRALVVAGVMALLAAAAITGPIAASRIDPAIAALSYFGFATAVAVRFGAIPFHVWAARVVDATPEVGLPLVTAWSPAAFAIVALSWTQAAVPAFVQPLVAERAIIVLIAALSIVLATAAACVNGDVEHVVGYSMVADGGIALLGLAVLDPSAWAATRMWLLAVVVTKTAFAAWAAALHSTFGTRKIADLHGWAIRSPVLGLALLGILVAGIGWPGMAVFAARATLIDLAVQSPYGVLLLAAALAAVLYYARLLLVGVATPGDVVLMAPERPTRRQPEPSPRLPRARRRRGLRRFSRPEMLAFWQARRTAIAGAAVLVLAGLSIGVAGGSFGVRAAAEALPPAASTEPGPESPGASAEPPAASPGEPSPSG